MHKSDQITDTLRQAAHALGQIQELWKESWDTIRDTELEIMDIMHELELEDVTDEKALELAKDIKTLRQRRRIAKDDQLVLHYLKEFGEKNGTFIARMGDMVEKMEKEIELRVKRTYTPRVRFNKMNVIKAQAACEEAAAQVAADLVTPPEEDVAEIGVHITQEEETHEEVCTASCPQQPWLDWGCIDEIERLCGEGEVVRTAGYRPYRPWDAYVDVCIQRMLRWFDGETDFWVRSVRSERPTIEVKRRQLTAPPRITSKERRRIKEFVNHRKQRAS